jgi:hypothetical protein
MRLIFIELLLALVLLPLSGLFWWWAFGMGGWALVGFLVLVGITCSWCCAAFAPPRTSSASPATTRSSKRAPPVRHLRRTLQHHRPPREAFCIYWPRIGVRESQFPKAPIGDFRAFGLNSFLFFVLPLKD